MIGDNVKVCAILRNFKSDCDYFTFGDPLDGFWIQKLNGGDKESLCSHKIGFSNSPWDNFLVGRHYYIGRGKSTSVLQDNVSWHFFPLFRAMKLFRTGAVVLPMAFYSWKGKHRSMRLHGENYGWGYGLKENPYVLNKSDVENFFAFFKELDSYQIKETFGIIPYRKPPDLLKTIDLRHRFAIHALLKGSMEHSNPFVIFDKLLDFTIAFESLYLLKNDKQKRTPLSKRVATLLGKDAADGQNLADMVGQFYRLRNDLVHASFIDSDGDKFLSENIHKYEEILRRSILAFLDLNRRAPTKEKIIRILDDAATQPALKKDIQQKSKLLNMTE
jgi:hypothetical protein